MVTLEIHNRNTGKNRAVQVEGFVKPSGTIVASVTNDHNEVYLVEVRADGKTSCKHAGTGEECKGHYFGRVQRRRERRSECYHVIAVMTTDLPSFDQVAAYSIAQAMAEANEQMCAYEREVAPVVVPQQPAIVYAFAYGSCGHIVKPQHAGTPCGACLCK
jgi:hypothetical protein